MRHDVQLPLLLPGLVAGLDAAFGSSAGVGEEHIDGTEAAFNLFDQADDGRLVGDVKPETESLATETIGRSFGRLAVSVDQHHGPGAVLYESAPHGRADPASATGDQGHPVSKLHGADPTEPRAAEPEGLSGEPDESEHRLGDLVNPL
jgi:hypothetical protein